MKFLAVVLLSLAVLLCFVGSVSSLKCITCHGASSFEECDQNDEQQCQVNQNACETVVRRYMDKIYVTKGCKQAMSCNNNQQQNNRPSGKSTQCNVDQVNSFCTCCCDGDSCNAEIDNCPSTVSVPTSPIVGHDNCQAPPTRFPHGNINCENGVCKYQCTDETYGLWPVGRDQNVCGADGNWQYDTPCCARPCPPYALYDDVSLYHLKSGIFEEMFSVLSELMKSIHVGPDSSLAAAFSYGSEPHVTSVINFNDYEYNGTLYSQLARKRLQAADQGPVNTGAAIQFAVDNILKSELGMRDNRVPKSISIVIDSNSDDDVKTAAENARSLGYLVYVYAYVREGVVYDDQQLLDITGDPKHIFKIGEFTEDFTAPWMQDMVDHFCSDPCVHVLHDDNLL